MDITLGANTNDSSSEQSVVNKKKQNMDFYKYLINSKLLPEESSSYLIKRMDLFEKEIEKRKPETQTEMVKYANYCQNLTKVFEPDEKTASSQHIENSCTVLKSMLKNISGRVLKELIQRYPENMENWEYFLKLVEEHHYFDYNQDLMFKLEEKHCLKVQSYVILAKLYFHWSRANHIYSRSILLKGIDLHHGKKPELYLEMIQYELDYVADLINNDPDVIRPNDAEELNGFINGVSVKGIFDLAKRHYGFTASKLPFYLEFVKPFGDYDCARQWQRDIINDICKKFSTEPVEVFYDLLVRSYDCPSGYDSLDKFYDHYCKLIQEKPTEDMYMFAINFFIEKLELHEKNAPANNLYDAQTNDYNYLKPYFTLTITAHDSDKLSTEGYFRWINSERKRMSIALSDELHSAIESMTKNKRLNNNPRVWMERLIHLKYYISPKASQDDIFQLFLDSVDPLGENALPFYLIVLSLFSIEHQFKKVKRIFKTGINNTKFPNLCNQLKVLHLEWSAICCNVQYLRKYFDKYSMKDPLNIDFHKLMFKIEEANRNPSLLKTICESSVRLFGDNNVDVWIDYIKFDYDYFNGRNVFTIHKEACEILSFSSSLLLEFKEKYKKCQPLRLSDISVSGNNGQAQRNTYFHDIGLGELSIVDTQSEGNITDIISNGEEGQGDDGITSNEGNSVEGLVSGINSDIEQPSYSGGDNETVTDNMLPIFHTHFGQP